MKKDNIAGISYPKLFFFLLLTLTLITLPGCWNRRELDTLAIVAGAAIDKIPGEEKIRITAQVINPSAMQSPQTGEMSAGAKEYVNFSETGTTVFEVARKITTFSSRKLYWPHNQVLILSEDICKHGISHWIDFFIRDHETRLRVKVLVSEGEARSILEKEAALEKLPAREIGEIVDGLASTSIAPQTTLRDFLCRMLEDSGAPVAPLISLKEKEGKKETQISGTAVFKRTRLVGTLDPFESRGFLFITGKVQSGIILIKCPGSEDLSSLEIINAGSETVPLIKDGKLSVTVKITEEGNLGCQMCGSDLTKPQTWQLLEEKQNKAILAEAMSSVKKAQELRADIFGFGEAFHRKYPLKWNGLKENWDEHFANLEVNIEVESHLRRSGQISLPPHHESRYYKENHL